MKTVCSNCFVDFSPQWRKIETLIYCNSCAIHFKRKHLHKIINHNYAKYLIDFSNNNDEIILLINLNSLIPLSFPLKEY